MSVIRAVGRRRRVCVSLPPAPTILFDEPGGRVRRVDRAGCWQWRIPGGAVEAQSSDTSCFFDLTLPLFNIDTSQIPQCLQTLLAMMPSKSEHHYI